VGLANPPLITSEIDYTEMRKRHNKEEINFKKGRMKNKKDC